jgi:hypothetical protein
MFSERFTSGTRYVIRITVPVVKVRFVVGTDYWLDLPPVLRDIPGYRWLGCIGWHGWYDSIKFWHFEMVLPFMCFIHLTKNY